MDFCVCLCVCDRVRSCKDYVPKLKNRTQSAQPDNNRENKESMKIHSKEERDRERKLCFSPTNVLFIPIVLHS